MLSKQKVVQGAMADPQAEAGHLVNAVRMLTQWQNEGVKDMVPSQEMVQLVCALSKLLEGPVAAGPVAAPPRTSCGIGVGN